MLVGVASLPPSLIPALWNIAILHHKKAKLRNNIRQSVKAKKNFVEKFVDSAIVKICDELDLRQTLRPVESTVEQSSNAPVIHFLVQLQR